MEPSGTTAAHGTHDSHGVPWAGRTLAPQPFAGDEGEPDADLTAALLAHAAGAARPLVVVAALARARVFVPVVATLGEGHPLPDHVRGDAGADMSLALLTDADGHRALPVFTGLSALRRWNEAARPVPVEAARAAQAAVADGCEAMVVDPAGPCRFVVQRAAVWAIGQGRSWLPAAEDPEVHQAVEDAARRVRHVRRASCEPGTRAELAVVLGVAKGLGQADLDALLDAVQRRLAASDVIAERVDTLELRVLPA